MNQTFNSTLRGARFIVKLISQKMDLRVKLAFTSLDYKASASLFTLTENWRIIEYLKPIPFQEPFS